MDGLTISMTIKAPLYISVGTLIGFVASIAFAFLSFSIPFPKRSGHDFYWIVNWVFELALTLSLFLPLKRWDKDFAWGYLIGACVTSCIVLWLMILATGAG